MLVQTADNLCVICGAIIPEGKQYCPMCGTTESDIFDKSICKDIPNKPEEFKTNDEIEQAFREGYTTGFDAGMKHSCIIKSDNERLKRENAFLKAQIETRNRVDDIDGCYD